MRTLLLPGLLLLLGFGSCQRELLDPKELHITTSSGFMFPLAHVNLDLEDLLPLDTTGPLTLGDQPFYTISFQEDSLIEVRASDLLQIPNQSPVALAAAMGRVALPDVQTAIAISLGALSSQITAPSNFGSTMASAHGSNAPFPALPTQNPGTLSSISLGSIQSADFAEGSLVMQLVNGFPAAMSATVALADAQGTELITFSFNNVAAGDSATDGKDLAGLLLPGTMDVILKNVSSPGAGTPGIPSTYVAIDTTDALQISLIGTGMKVRSATATLNTQTVVDSTLWIGFTAPTGVEITEIGLLSGQLDYSITSGFPEDVLLSFSLPGSSAMGGPAWAQTLTVLKNSTVFGAFPWAGISLDLTQDSALPFNRLPLAYEVMLLASGQPVTLDSSQIINFSFTLSNVGMDYIYGFFGQESITLPADTIPLAFPALERLQGSIIFAQPSLTLHIASETFVGIPITLDLGVASSKPDGTVVALSNDPVLLNWPVLPSQMGQNGYVNLGYHATNSNIVDVLSWPKTGVAFGGTVAYNLDTVATGRLNYLSHSSSMKVGAECILPFALTASGLSFTDSVEVKDWTASLHSDSSAAVSAQMSIHSISHFPLDAALHLRFYDNLGQVVWAQDVPLVHSATVDPTSGYVTQPTVATDVLTLDSLAMEQIAQAVWLELEATMETFGGGQDPVKLQASNGLELHIGMQVEFEKVIL